MVVVEHFNNWLSTLLETAVSGVFWFYYETIKEIISTHIEIKSVIRLPAFLAFLVPPVSYFELALARAGLLFSPLIWIFKNSEAMLVESMERQSWSG